MTVNGNDAGGGEGTRPRFDWMGIDRDSGRSTGGDDDSASAPDVPQYGLTAEELYAYQRAFTQYAASRLLGVGKEQYDHGGVQKFEDMGPYEIAVGLREELADVVNYAVMLDVTLQRLAKAWGKANA